MRGLISADVIGQDQHHFHHVRFGQAHCELRSGRAIGCDPAGGVALAWAIGDCDAIGEPGERTMITLIPLDGHGAALQPTVIALAATKLVPTPARDAREQTVTY